VKVEFRTSFLKDITKIKSKAILKGIKDTIENVEDTEDFQKISDLKKLKGGDHYYRIRVNEYRIGLSIAGDTWVFVRCLHRKDIYRYFP
jgi:mRNA interferase RelE/StbE